MIKVVILTHPDFYDFYMLKSAALCNGDILLELTMYISYDSVKITYLSVTVDY